MRFFKQIALLALMVGVGLNLTACQPGDSKAKNQPSLVSINVSPASATVMMSSTQALKVMGTFSNSSSLDVTSASSFSVTASSPAGVVLVSSAGVVTAVKAGTATITATHNGSGMTATATITVPAAVLVSIAVTPTAPAVAPGATQPLTVTGTYNEGSKAVIATGLTFASSDSSIATVGASGVVAGVATGTATITTTETTSGKSTTTLVTVTAGGGGGGTGCGTTVPTCAPATTIPADNVMIYSDGASVPGFDSCPNWGQATICHGEVTIAGNKSLWYSALNYEGLDWSSNPVNVSSRSKLHIDFWTPDLTSVKVSLISAGKENAVTQVLTTASWNSVDIDLSNYTTPDLSAIIQIKLESTTPGTLYVDNIYFWGTAGGGGGGGGGTTIVTFDEVPSPKLTDFGVNGAPPVIATDPAGGTNKVLKVFKYAQPPPGSEQWAGVTVSTQTVPLDSIPAIPFTATNKTMTVRAYSPAVGVRVRLKVEDASNPGVSCETDAITTTSGAWETLTFNFANPGLSPPVGGGPTSPLDLTKTYNKVSIFSDFGIGNGGSAPLSADRVYYYDDITFVGPAGGGGGGGGGGTAPTNAPTTVIPAGSVTIYSDAASIAGFDSCPNWGQATVCHGEQTIAGNKTLWYSALNYEGLDWSSNPVNVSAKGKLHIDFWTPDLTSVKVSIISAGKENAVTQVLTTGSWNGVDIDLSNYTVPDLSAIIQIKLESTTPGTLYVDNIYFWGAAAGASCGTTAPTCAPTTTVPSGSVTIYSDAATVAGFDSCPNWGQATVCHGEVSIAANNSLWYSGLTYEGLDWAANPVNVSAKGKLHIDFWTPDLTSVKVSIISAGKENAVTQALTTGSWNGVDIDLSNYTVPDLTAIIQIKLESTTPGTLYVDNIYFWGTAGGGGGGGCTEMGCAGAVTIPVATVNDVFGFIQVGDGIFAQDYVGALEGNGNHGAWAGATTIGAASGGSIGYYNDPLMSNSAQKIDEGGWVSGTIDNPGGVPSFFRYFVFTAPGSTFAASYMGLYANSPTNGTVDVSGYASIKLKLWGPAEMYQVPGFDPVIEIVLAGPKVAGCAATGSGGTEISRTFTANQKIGAGSSYKLSLAGWTVKGLCGTDTSGTAVASVLGHLARVAVTVPASSFNFTNANAGGPPTTYATGVNLGPVAFTNN
jgi:hypothetical protein